VRANSFRGGRRFRELALIGSDLPSLHQEESKMDKLLATLVMAFGVAIVPARAFAANSGPVELTDAQLDEVTAGVGPPAFVLAAGHGPPFMRSQGSSTSQPTTQINVLFKDIAFTYNIGSNSQVNMATVLQLALLSQPVQSGSAAAVQGGH
jgi:hypothetical protein